VIERLYILAFDHRTSLMTSFFGVDGEPSAEDVERAGVVKQVIWEGLLKALADGTPREFAAALVDGRYGLDVIRAARAEGVQVAVPVEASGRAELELEFTDWQARMRDLDPTWAKVLVRYNPGGDADMNRRQRSKLRGMAQRFRDGSRGFMLELLVPPEPAQLEAVGGDLARYDLEIRPELMVRAIGEIRLDEIGPNVWKVEGLDSGEDCDKVARAAGSPCVVLGRGADRDAVDRWLRAAAKVPGYVGFAIGRSIWWEAMQAFFADGADEAARATAVAAIAAVYRRYVDVYTDAAAG